MEAWRTPTGKVARKMYFSQEGEGGAEAGTKGGFSFYPLLIYTVINVRLDRARLCANRITFRSEPECRRQPNAE